MLLFIVGVIVVMVVVDAVDVVGKIIAIVFELVTVMNERKVQETRKAINFEDSSDLYRGNEICKAL